MVSDIYRTLIDHHEGTNSRNQLAQTGVSGESPPPRPRACFGRDDLIEKFVGLVESLVPIALIGAGGIGKTSIALVVLHHDRIKKRFGNDRRFIRCDKFPASCSHFLARLSKVIGAGIENPSDLTPLRPFLCSKEMVIILDNAESSLDPQGIDGRGVYQIVEELSQFSNICLVITSRITTIPTNCEVLEIPTLSTKAGYDAFYNIYKRGGRSDSVNNILKQLDFHPLSVTLLATVAHQNRWDSDRLAREWGDHQTEVLQTEHQTSLANTIELSIASPMFKALGPDAQGLLEVVAFYPHGINEDSSDWLFPTISNTTRIFDKLCALSLTYRSGGFITMLAPLRDYFRPKDPQSSPLLCTTKGRYFSRMSTTIDPNDPKFKDARWIVSEDVNVEHLLDVFTSVNPDSDDIWSTHIKFINHLRFHKPRQTVLKAKIEGLPDNHPFKPECFVALGTLSGLVGNYMEQMRFLDHALRLFKEQGNDSRVAFILRELSKSNRMLGHHKEGMDQAKEALEIYERLGKTTERVLCLNILARSLHEDGQLDAAEEAVVHAIGLLPEKGQEYPACDSHHTLGDVYYSKGQVEKAIHHLKIALGIASSFDWHYQLFWIHFALAQLFLAESGFDDARSHIQQAGSYALENAYLLGLVALLWAQIWFRQHKLRDATSQALLALENFEKVGAPQQEHCRIFLQKIEQASMPTACTLQGLDHGPELVAHSHM